MSQQLSALKLLVLPPNQFSKNRNKEEIAPSSWAALEDQTSDESEEENVLPGVGEALKELPPSHSFLLKRHIP